MTSQNCQKCVIQGNFCYMSPYDIIWTLWVGIRPICSYTFILFLNCSLLYPDLEKDNAFHNKGLSQIQLSKKVCVSLKRKNSSLTTTKITINLPKFSRNSNKKHNIARKNIILPKQRNIWLIIYPSNKTSTQTLVVRS